MNVYGVLTGTLTSSKTVTGTLSIPNAVDARPYEGPYEVTPKAWLDQTLETEGLLMTDDVTVFKVPYYETVNLFDGKTAYIAEEV